MPVLYSGSTLSRVVETAGDSSVDHIPVVFSAFPPGQQCGSKCGSKRGHSYLQQDLAFHLEALSAAWVCFTVKLDALQSPYHHCLPSEVLPPYPWYSNPEGYHHVGDPSDRHWTCALALYTFRTQLIA
jgi:hypothetical protein